MNYYKYLDIDFSVASEKIRKFLEARPELISADKGAWVMAPREIIREVPELLTMFSPLKLDVLMVGFFIMHYKIGSIHTDGTQIPIRINFPILNCDQTETRYFEATGETRMQSQLNGNSYVQYHPDRCRQIDKFSLTKAVAMRVLEPHQVVVMHDRLPRISCTVAFKQDLSHLLD